MPDTRKTRTDRSSSARPGTRERRPADAQRKPPAKARPRKPTKPAKPQMSDADRENPERWDGLWA